MCPVSRRTSNLEQAPIPAPDNASILHIEIWRTILFMLMVVRFYVGSVVFFHKVHGASAPETGSNYYLDFVMGFTQFVFFYAWSVTIFSYSRSPKGFSYYMSVMFLILLFDLVWLLFNVRNDTTETIKIWTVVNLLTALVAFACFITSARLFDLDAQSAEEISLIPVGLVSILDLTENVSGRPIFIRMLQLLMPKPISPRATAPASSAPAGAAGDPPGNPAGAQ